jgi:predicted GNAT superfamily acetyltransferase
LNIARLGAVCDTYLRSAYGEMRDSLNAGLPSDRFQVDWWVNTTRVERRLSRRSRPALTLDQYRTAEVSLHEALHGLDPGPRPPEKIPALAGSMLLVEIPADFQAVKEADLGLARDWRFYCREVFETAFAAAYLVTDFVYDGGRSFYVLTDGKALL